MTTTPTPVSAVRNAIDHVGTDRARAWSPLRFQCSPPIAERRSIVLPENRTRREAPELMQQHTIDHLPVVDATGKVIDLVEPWYRRADPAVDPAYERCRARFRGRGVPYQLDCAARPERRRLRKRTRGISAIDYVVLAENVIGKKMQVSRDTGRA
jgi:hypothetical protein